MRGLLLFLLAVSITSLNAGALSVVSDYLANDTLILVEGASKIYSIRLQNTNEYEIGIKLDYDRSFMKVIDYKEIYTLAPKETGYRVLFNVTAPEKTGLHRVGYVVSEVEPSGGGGLPIRLRINRNFNLRVIEDPNKFRIKNEHFAYAAIILAFLLYIFWKRQSARRLRRKPRKFL